MVEELSGSFGNPATAGVFLVHGWAHHAKGSAPWRMVVKVHRDPRTVEKEFVGSHEDHWNYWLRELDLVTSAFFQDLPGAFSVPTFFGAEQRADDQVWTWDGGRQRRRCSLEPAALRGRRPYLTGTPLPSNSSLCRYFLGSWVDTLHRSGKSTGGGVAGLWRTHAGRRPTRKMTASAGGGGRRRRRR